jgi:hypothetical protein
MSLVERHALRRLTPRIANTIVQFVWVQRVWLKMDTGPERIGHTSFAKSCYEPIREDPVHCQGSHNGWAGRRRFPHLGWPPGHQVSNPGAEGRGTNPEQLFAAGWSACFLSAIKLVAGKKRIALPSDIAIDAEVDLGLVHGVHHLAARLNVNLPGMDQETAP